MYQVGVRWCTLGGSFVMTICWQ
uniref:Uncharacterized protein n=1 Tax=Anguilla anguilla TaxID=7936 RepID=A0A0E9SH05_ANGAN